VIVGAQELTVQDEVTSVVEEVQACMAVVVLIGSTVVEVRTVEVFLPIGQLVIVGAQDVMVYSLVVVKVDIDDC
jgi:hypothetical protein